LNNREIPSQPDEIRRAQLVAAAETLVAWVHERRATWDDVPARVDLTSISQIYQATAAPPLVDLDSEVSSSSESPGGAGRSFKWPSISLAGPLAVLGSLGSLLKRLGGGATQLGAGAARLGPAVARIAVIAGILVALGVAGWTARPYLMKAITTPKTGTAAFESLPPSEVLVDGVSIGTAPLTADLAAGHHVIQFRRSRGVRSMEIDVVGGRATTTRLDWDALQTGRLMARSDPPGAKVLVDGKDRGVTPLTLEDVTLGSHTVVLQSSDGTVRRTVTVTADRAAVVTESIFAGFLKLFAPFELQVSEGTRAVRLDDQHQAMLPPGVHELRFENSELGYSDTRRVEVQPGQTTSLSLVPSPSLLTVVASTASTVIIDGQQVGETPLTNHPIALGTRDIIVRSAGGEERRFTRTVTVAPVSIDVNF